MFLTYTEHCWFLNFLNRIVVFQLSNSRYLLSWVANWRPSIGMKIGICICLSSNGNCFYLSRNTRKGPAEKMRGFKTATVIKVWIQWYFRAHSTSGFLHLDIHLELNFFQNIIGTYQRKLQNWTFLQIRFWS